MDVTPIGKLEMGQFSFDPEELPVLEKQKDHLEDGKFYRSSMFPDRVFVYRENRGDFDCFIMG